MDSMINYLQGSLAQIQINKYDRNKNKTQYTEYNMFGGNGVNPVSTIVYNYYYEDYDDDPTGINLRTKNNLDIFVYPNPAGSLLRYRLHADQYPADMLLNLYEVSGRKIFQSRIDKKRRLH